MATHRDGDEPGDPGPSRDVRYTTFVAGEQRANPPPTDDQIENAEMALNLPRWQPLAQWVDHLLDDLDDPRFRKFVGHIDAPMLKWTEAGRAHMLRRIVEIVETVQSTR